MGSIFGTQFCTLLMKKVLATANDERDTISKQTESTMIEPKASHEALIQVKSNFATISTFQTNSSNRIFNFKIPRFQPYDRMKTLDAITSFRSRLHCHFGPHSQEFWLTAEFGILLTYG